MIVKWLPTGLVWQAVILQWLMLTLQSYLLNNNKGTTPTTYCKLSSRCCNWCMQDTYTQITP